MNLNFKLTNKTILYLAVWSLLFILILWLGVMRPVQRVKSLNKVIPKKEKELQKLIALREEYSQYKLKMEAIDQKLKTRQKDFAIFSLLEKLALKAQVKEHIEYMKPSSFTATSEYKELSVKMALKGVSLRQLVNYLYEIEASNQLLNIKLLDIIADRTSGTGLRATFEVSTYALEGHGG